MKLKSLAFTFLICMISFAGFSLATTDLCQDSNHEIVALAETNDIHGVADLFVENTNIYSPEKHFSVVSYQHVKKLDEADIVFLRESDDIERRIREPDQHQIKKNRLEKILIENHVLEMYRSPRDGLNYKA